MNDLTRVKQIKLEPFSFEQMLEHVWTNVGYFSIGFRSQNEEQREAIRRARTKNEQANSVMADSLKTIEEGAPHQRNGVVRWLFSWLPEELLLSAIRYFTSNYKYTHCEMAFLLRRDSKLRTTDVNVLAVAVSSDCGVYVMPRRFNIEYEWHHVRCDEPHMIAMLFFAFEEQGKRFSRFMMSKSPITPGPDDRREYFCSHFTMACLERLPAPQFHFNRANAQSIDDIYEMATAENVRATHVVEVPNAQMTKLYGKATDLVLPQTQLTDAQKVAKERALRKKV